MSCRNKWASGGSSFGYQNAIEKSQLVWKAFEARNFHQNCAASMWKPFDNYRLRVSMITAFALAAPIQKVIGRNWSFKLLLFLSQFASIFFTFLQTNLLAASRVLAVSVRFFDTHSQHCENQFSCAALRVFSCTKHFRYLDFLHLT